jgi:predicted transcriptional regulator
MSAISLKLPNELLEASSRYADALHVSRAEYIRQAIARMNQAVEAQLRATRLAAASHKVRQESMRVNAEFAAFETEPDA